MLQQIFTSWSGLYNTMFWWISDAKEFMWIYDERDEHPDTQFYAHPFSFGSVLVYNIPKIQSVNK